MRTKSSIPTSSASARALLRRGHALRRSHHLLAGVVGLALLVVPSGARAEGKIPALIVDGMNNHDWPRATRILKEVLLASGRFTVDVSTTPPAGAPAEAWAKWRPDFSTYAVVINNFNGGDSPRGVRWPDAVEAALEKYVATGGGLVIYHAANNAFREWPAYNEMIGLGWRDKNFGPSLIIDANEKVVTIPAGEGRGPGHGPEHDFEIVVRDHSHPITQGLPRRWLHPHEQLTHGQHGPAKNLNVLTYAWSKDTNERQPLDWTVTYGKGRVYVTMLGHLWKDGLDTALRDPNFQRLFTHGCEWAAGAR